MQRPGGDVYKSVGDKNFLENLEIDYSVEGIRLPTEMEWELAAHGGVYGSTYYWGNEPASDYAYYGQPKGYRTQYNVNAM